MWQLVASCQCALAMLRGRLFCFRALYVTSFHPPRVRLWHQAFSAWPVCVCVYICIYLIYNPPHGPRCFGQPPWGFGHQGSNLDFAGPFIQQSKVGTHEGCIRCHFYVLKVSRLWKSAFSTNNDPVWDILCLRNLKIVFFTYLFLCQ